MDEKTKSLVKEIEEIDGTIEFNDEDIEKYLTKTEADILYVLHTKIFDGRKNNDVERRVKNRVHGMIDHRASFLVRFDYNNVDVFEVEDPRPIGGVKIKDIFETYPKKYK